jgi:hypothetical protein
MEAAGNTVKVGVGLLFTVMLTRLLVAGLLLIQLLMDDVNTTETTSLFNKVLVLKVLLFVPAFTPFTFH